jgi:hypothetical protein
MEQRGPLKKFGAFYEKRRFTTARPSRYRFQTNILYVLICSVSLGSKVRPVRRADNLTAICEPTVYIMWYP